jgi:hypothetical protein
MPNNGRLNLYTGNRGANLYGGRRGNRLPPYLNRIQIRRIVSLIFQLVAIYYLVGISMDMAPRDAMKIRTWLLSSIVSFKNIVTTYFSGYQRGIEASASALVSVIWRKLQMGRGINLTNAVVAATAFTMAYTTGTGVNNTVRGLGSYSNSTLSRLIGTTERNAKNVQAAIVSMIAWLTASLRSSSTTTIAEIVYDIQRTYHLRSLSKRNFINYGTNRLRIRNGNGNNNAAAQALLNLRGRN